MIVSFCCKKSQLLFEEHVADKKFRAFDRKALMKLNIIDAAETIKDLMVPPGNRLEKLKGDRDGYYSIRVNDQWRICFIWDELNRAAFEVEIVDYH